MKAKKLGKAILPMLERTSITVGDPLDFFASVLGSTLPRNLFAQHLEKDVSVFVTHDRDGLDPDLNVRGHKTDHSFSVEWNRERHAYDVHESATLWILTTGGSVLGSVEVSVTNDVQAVQFSHHSLSQSPRLTYSTVREATEGLLAVEKEFNETDTEIKSSLPGWTVRRVAPQFQQYEVRRRGHVIGEIKFVYSKLGTDGGWMYILYKDDVAAGELENAQSAFDLMLDKYISLRG